MHGKREKVFLSYRAHKEYSQTAYDVRSPLMAPYLKADAADMRLQGECRTVDDLSEKTRQSGCRCCCQDKYDRILSPVMYLQYLCTKPNI